MRGLAALMASASVWVMVTGYTPHVEIRWRADWRVILGGVGVAALATIVTYGLLGSVTASLAIGLLASVLPATITAAKQRKAIAERIAGWPDILGFVRAGIASGATLPDAFLDACERVGGAYGETVPALRMAVVFGGGFRVAMDEMRETLDDGITDRVTRTLAIAERSGGTRVGDVVAALQSSVSDEVRLRRAHDAAMTEQRWTAGVALVAPWILLVLSIATNPQAAGAFDSPEAVVVVGIGFVATVAGGLLARRTARLARPPRVFR